jgi:hypothetical protein
LPEDKETTVDILVWFERSEEEAMGRAHFTNAAGMEIQQIAPGYVRADIVHASPVVHWQTECSVECPRTGKRITGVNVCIECTTNSGATFQICC